jgi:hypothetical protein
LVGPAPRATAAAIILRPEGEPIALILPGLGKEGRPGESTGAPFILPSQKLAEKDLIWRPA